MQINEKNWNIKPLIIIFCWEVNYLRYNSKQRKTNVVCKIYIWQLV